jgi:hypothetical protein
MTDETATPPGETSAADVENALTALRARLRILLRHHCRLATRGAIDGLAIHPHHAIVRIVALHNSARHLFRFFVQLVCAHLPTPFTSSELNRLQQ